MANFSYSDYQQVIARAQANSEGGNGTKVGFFKMKNDKDEALIRLNVTSLDSLQFATVHQLGAAQKWMKVGCLNPVGSYQDACPLCAAVKGGNTSIGKASKKVYIQMLVSYKDAVTGQFAAAIPVIWERPAAFSQEIANLLKDYGDLTQRVFKITRNGVAGNMQTTYSISYIPIYDKPEAVSTDFSAFTNFNIAKHSYWEKTVGDINVFLNTGSFPEAAKTAANQAPAQAVPAYTAPAYAAPAATVAAAAQYAQVEAPAAPVATAFAPAAQPSFVPPAFGNAQAPQTFTPPAYTAPAAPAAPVSQPAQSESTQQVGADFGRAPRTFGGPSF
jgi:hypothetical protein